MKTVPLLIIFSILSCLSINLVIGECCPKYMDMVCADGSIKLKGHYCGVGKCNIAGCNCVGGCRKLGSIQPFDILGFKRGYGFHLAVAINGTHIAHNNGESVKYDINYIYRDDFEKGKVVRFNEYYKLRLNKNPKRGSEILKSIQSDIGKKTYDLVAKNCEHFATKWVFGNDVSCQVDKWVAAGDETVRNVGAGVNLPRRP